mgnify:CR=1 FL=1
MKKNKLIKEVESILSKNGLNQEDYVISLQGPTLIMSKSGNVKLNNNLDVKIELIKLITIL